MLCCKFVDRNTKNLIFKYCQHLLEEPGMNEDEKLAQLIVEAQGILNRLVKRFEVYKEKEIKTKSRELKEAADQLNKQLTNIALLSKRVCSYNEVKLADDIVFQLSIYDDICEGFLTGI